MRFMLIVKADERSEAGVMPTDKELADMGRFNDEMVKAGRMIAGEGLQPSSKGARVDFSKGKPTVIDGPFTEAKELIAGFWLMEARSLEEAVEWARRAPFEDGQIEVRQVFELEDFNQTEALDLHRKHREQLGRK
jgi:hypothetical protein